MIIHLSNTIRRLIIKTKMKTRKSVKLSAIVIHLTQKEMKNLEQSDVVSFVVLLERRITEKYPQLNLTGKYDVNGNVIKFFFKSKKLC